MTERPRNIIVGLTFLSALGVCMYGIILLGKFPAFGAIHQYSVTLVTSNANGVATGSKVEFNGVYAGQVESTWLASDAQGNAIVNVKLMIDPGIDIPASAGASLQRPAAVGSPYVSLTAQAFKPPFLTKDGKATLSAMPGDSSLIPKDVFADVHELKENLTVLSSNLNTVAKDLHALLAYTPPEAVASADPNDPNRPRANASTLIIRVDRTVESLQALLTDPKLQGQVRDVVQNIAEASGKLKATLTKFDSTLDNANTAMASIGTAANSVGGAATQANITLEATRKDIDRVSQQMVETLAQLDKSIRAVTEGPGTTGKLVNDPRLFEGLVDLSKSLKTTVEDLDFLLQKWKDEGVNLKLK